MNTEYVAVKLFLPRHGQGWQEYIAWSKLDHLVELISLDCMLCPTVFEADTLSDEDWAHKSDGVTWFDSFTDLDYLLRHPHLSRQKPFQVLAFLCNPEADDVDAWDHPGFLFKGFDFIDETRTSALTNCGGFPKAFQKSDLSDCGLIPGFERAREIQEALRRYYPEQAHADCDMLAIWRREAPDEEVCGPAAEALKKIRGETSPDASAAPPPP